MRKQVTQSFSIFQSKMFNLFNFFDECWAPRLRSFETSSRIGSCFWNVDCQLLPILCTPHVVDVWCTVTTYLLEKHIGFFVVSNAMNLFCKFRSGYPLRFSIAVGVPTVFFKRDDEFSCWHEMKQAILSLIRPLVIAFHNLKHWNARKETCHSMITCWTDPLN